MQGELAVAGRNRCTASSDVDADYAAISVWNFTTETNEIRQIPQTQSKANVAEIRARVVVLWLSRITGDQLCG